ncbi:hypothetical protein Vretimale_4653 [Volvox reticuliferus]|nr:hypothetical protein Vretifemale_3253 [Volvox reticuliferus]GIL99497.1 hypothetical protein Vretimale_4653 [Volvox reticuliferus]
MSLFDGDVCQPPSKTVHGVQRSSKSTARGEGCEARDQTKVDGSELGGTSASTMVKPRQTRSLVDRGHSASSTQGAPDPLGSPNCTGSRQQAKRSSMPTDEIDTIMRSMKKEKRSRATSSKGPEPGDKVCAAKVASKIAARQSLATKADVLRRERKLFMSHKASKVHEAVHVNPVPATQEVEDGVLSPDDFQKMQLEVEKFAAGALDKKSAKLYKARMLARLGAKADTAPRTAASIGKGMAKTAAKRQARALEEAIESGMVQRKGLNKKKRAWKAKNRDRGLMEAGPSFKNGVLRIKPLKKMSTETGKFKLPKGVL